MDKAGDVLNKLSIFNNINLEDAQNYSKLFNSWEIIVGNKIAGYSRIKDLDKSSLIIEADHPAIIQLLQIDYGNILFKLNKKYPQLKISEIRIFLKDPKFKIERKNNNLDKEQISEEKNMENFDIKNMDEGNFRDLLLKMKKRSQL